jgi:hypothetical protein
MFLPSFVDGKFIAWSSFSNISTTGLTSRGGAMYKSGGGHHPPPQLFENYGRKKKLQGLKEKK